VGATAGATTHEGFPVHDVSMVTGSQFDTPIRVTPTKMQLWERYGTAMVGASSGILTTSLSNRWKDAAAAATNGAEETES
jgi:hypothetical protein